MEASTLQAPTTLAKPRVAAPTPFLRLRSDEQLVALFRAGHDDAFRAIHDRYNKRLLAYARQMLPGRQDAEDALQDVFVRAYSGLRANDRDLALRAWLFRVAHNRCIDELRRPAPPPPEVLHLVRSTVQDPVAEVDLRESLRRLIADVRRLPDQQRSALLLRELGGLSYAELATSLGISVGAVKSVLVRARIALAQAAEARDTACSEIREELVGSYDRGVRPNANARRHMRDCAGCRDFRHELRGLNRQLAALAPAVGPLGFLAQLLGFSGGAGGSATAGGATAGGATAGGATAGGATAGGAAIAGGGGATASAGAALGAGHVATLIAAAVATAGGAVAIQHTIAPAHRHHAKAHVAGTRGAHHAAPARQIGSPADAAADGYAPSAAAAASAGAAAQKARAAVLAHHKHNRQAELSGTGGGALIGSMGKDGSGKTAAGLATGTAVSGAAKRKASATASATGTAAGSCSAATGTESGGSTGSGTGTATGAATGTGTGKATAPATESVTATGTGSGTAASTPNATATASETATGANSTPCSTTGNGSSSTSNGSGTGTSATGSGSSGSSSASTGTGSAASPSAASSTSAWY